MWRSSPFWKGLAGAIIGVVTMLLTIHAYTDHVAFHTLLDFLNTHAGKIAKLP